MTWVDLAVLSVLLVSALLAFMRGFVSEVLGITAWLVAGLVALWAEPYARSQVEHWMDQFVKMPALVTPVTYGGVFLAVLIIMMILSRWIGELVLNSMLSGLDRSLGVVFGLARGAVLVICAYIGTQMLIPIGKWPEPVLKSRSIHITYWGAVDVVQALPERYRPHVDEPPAGREVTVDTMDQATASGRATDKPVKK